MLRTRKTMAAVGAMGLCAGMLFTAVPALADDAARANDVVGVGSDTVQYAGDFLADGDTSGDAGFNASNLSRRMINDLATGDGNGRALYNDKGALLSGGTGTTSLVLRAGTAPVQRPDGSGAGIAALTADSVGSGSNYGGLQNGSINFVRASRLPKASEQASCAAISGCLGLHVYQYGSDNLEMAKWSGGTSNAVPLSGSELVSIYTCATTKWNQLTGNSGGSGNTIHPIIPQSGSGTRNFFLADLAAFNGGTAPTPGSCVRISEEHDPTGITLDPSPQDAIEPFSVAKALLIGSNYFANSGEVASDFSISLMAGCTGETVSGQQNDQGACGTTGLNANGGHPITSGDGTNVYDTVRGVYFIARDKDLASTTPMQVGGTKNFVQILFSGSTSLIAKSASASLIQAAGFVQAYADLNDASSG